MNKLARFRRDHEHAKAGSLAIITGASGDITCSLRCLDRPEPALLARKGVHFDELELMQTRWSSVYQGREIGAGTPVIVIERLDKTAFVEIFGSKPAAIVEVAKHNLEPADARIICGFERIVAV